MASKREIIHAKFPDKIWWTDYHTQDDGQGEYIRVWNQSAMGVPQPNDAQLAAWETQVQPKLDRKQQKAQKRANYKSNAPNVNPSNIEQIVQDLVDMYEDD